MSRLAINTKSRVSTRSIHREVSNLFLLHFCMSFTFIDFQHGQMLNMYEHVQSTECTSTSTISSTCGHPRIQSFSRILLIVHGHAEYETESFLELFDIYLNCSIMQSGSSLAIMLVAFKGISSIIGKLLHPLKFSTKNGKNNSQHFSGQPCPTSKTEPRIKSSPVRGPSMSGSSRILWKRS